MTRWLRAARGEPLVPSAGHRTEGTQRTEASPSEVPSVLSECPTGPTPSQALLDALEAAEERAAIREFDGGEDRESAEVHALTAHEPAIIAAIRGGALYPGPVSREADLPGVRYQGTVTYQLLARLIADGRVRCGALGELSIPDDAQSRPRIEREPPGDR